MIEATRAKALATHGDFVEAVWKDKKGRPVVPSAIHRLIYRFLDEAYARKVKALVVAPRGIGKTDILTGYAARLIAKNPKACGAYCCDKIEAAVDRVALVKRYIEQDEDYRTLFPKVRLERAGRGRRSMGKFRITENKTAKDATLEARGITAAIAGGRKDWLLIDDICNEKTSVQQPKDRERIVSCLHSDLLPILEPDDSWAAYIATIYHKSDATGRLLDSNEWATLVIGVSDDFTYYDVQETWPGDPTIESTCPLWVEHGFTESKYRSIWRECVKAGRPEKYTALYKSKLVDRDTAIFKYEWPGFQLKYDRHDPSYYPIRVLYADPASSTKKSADWYAGVVVGWDPALRAAVVLDAWRKREALTPRATTYLWHVGEWRPTRCRIETRSDLPERIREIALEGDIPLRLEPVSHNQNDDKVERVSVLGMLIESGRLLVDIERWPFFWQEAELFPRGDHDDALDALEGAYEPIGTWLLSRHGGVPHPATVLKILRQGLRVNPMAGQYRRQFPGSTIRRMPSAARDFFHL